MPAIRSAACAATFAALALCLAGHTPAAVYCVSSSAQLQQALIDAGADAVDDEIRILVGTYVTPVTPVAGFRYVSGQPGDLVISGAWLSDAPIGVPPNCAMQSPDPALTMLDGNYQTEALVLQPGAGSGDLAVHNLTLTRGSAMGSGGGMLVSPFDPSWSGNLTLQSLRVLANEATGSGAGLWISVPHGWLRLQNAVLAGNVAGTFGGGAEVVLNGNSSLIANLTVADNSSNDVFGAGLVVGGNAAAALMNSVLWNNAPEDLRLNGSAIRLHHDYYDTRIGQAPIEEFGTLAGNPMLGGGSLGLTPTPGSPLVDHGLPVSGGLPQHDLDAGQRIVGPAVDVGAFEAQLFADGYEGPDDWERPPPIDPN